MTSAVSYLTTLKTYVPFVPFYELRFSTRIMGFLYRVWNVSWQITKIMQDIHSQLSSFNSWSIHHFHREANKAADCWITNVNHLVSNNFFIDIAHYSSYLSSILVNDDKRIPHAEGFLILSFVLTVPFKTK